MRTNKVVKKKKRGWEGVSEGAKQWIEEYKKTGAWFKNATKFESGYYLQPEYKEIALQLFDSINEKKINEPYKWHKEFEILLANLIDTNGKCTIQIPKNSNEYTNIPLVSYSRIIELLRLLEKHKLMEMKNGYCFVDGDKQVTKIWTTKNLLQLFPQGNSGVRFKPISVVELWKSEKIKKIDSKTNRPRTHTIKTQLPVKETEVVKRMTKILERLNEINNGANICITIDGEEQRLNVAVVAKFTNKQTLGGRLYAKGRMYFQQYNGEERKGITFNGKETVEVDFTALHPMLLYAGENIPYSSDPYKVVDDRPELRPFLKIILLCMVNAADFNDARRAADDWLLHKSDPEIRKNIYKLGITKSKPFLERFLEIHTPIAKHLCSGRETGLKLTNKDALIAIEIVNHFVKQNIPILTMHDSFLVEKKYHEELKKVMLREYKKLTGFEIKIK